MPAYDQARDGLNPQKFTISSNSIQLNQVPDKFIIVARKPMSQQNWNDTSSFLPISNIVCNFNNQSGLLSSSTQVDLWKFSMSNASAQTWNSFNGFANVQSGDGVGQVVPTTGSMLVLSPSIQFGLPNYLASGSQGNFNFQFNLTVYNTLPYDVQPEIVLIAVNSGIMVVSQGIANIYTGILTKEIVLKTCEEQAVEPVTSVEYNRLVGGKLGNMALTALNRIHKRRPFNHGVLQGGEDSGGGHSRHAVHGGKHHGHKKKAHALI